MVATSLPVAEVTILATSQPGKRLGRLALCCLVAAIASAATACKSEYSASASRNQPVARPGAPRPVKSARVVEMPMELTVTVTGALAAYDQATISSKVPGRLDTIMVDLGSVVRQGQMIAQVEPQDYQLRLQQAEAALAQVRVRLGLPPEGTDDRVDPENTATVRQALAVMEEARANRNRVNALFDQGVIPRAQLDTAEAGFKVAQSRYQDAVEEIRNRQALLAQRRSELALAGQQLADTAIYAPFDGIVQERRASLGEYLAAGAPVVTIVRMNPVRFRAEVPERAAPSVRAGQLVRVSVEGDSNIYTGRIMRLSPTIMERNRMLVVEADVTNNGSLRPGSFARADIVTNDRATAIAVPATAVVSFAGISKVILVQAGKAIERPITTGRRTNKWIEVTSGVSVGETIVLDPGNLQSGQMVQVVE